MFYFLLLNSAAALTCYPYQCAPSDLELLDNQCIKYVNQTYFTRPCEDNTYCAQTQPETDALCQAVVEPTQHLYPGADCTSNNECISNNCQSKTCQGAGENKECKSSADCNPGLYCKDKLCADLIKVNETGCIIDYDCVNNAGCNLENGIGTCITYFTVEAGNTVSSCENNLNKLCSSYRCEDSVCTSAVESYITPPVYCSVDSGCSSRLDSVTHKFYSGTCECSYSTKGLSYCPLFPGDYIYQQRIKYLECWYDSDSIHSCHTYDRNSFDCMNRTWTYEEYLTTLYYSTWAEDYPKLQDNDECTQQMFSNDFWEAKENYDNYDTEAEQERNDSAVMLAIISLAYTLTII